jgi:hypothetical protein
MATMTRDDVMRSTAAHIRRVGELLVQASADLAHRAVHHDASKWSEEEWPAFESATPKLAAMTYGSEEYKAALQEIKPALAHHYGANQHHPEYFGGDWAAMSLLDLIEMLCDWKAASERHEDGSLERSITINQERFGYSDHMRRILWNTAVDMDLL